MSVSKQTISVATISVILAGGLGFAIGSSMKSKGSPPLDIENEHPNGGLAADQQQQQQQQPPAQQQGPTAWDGKSVDELTTSLSEIMLPEEEYNKLGDAIYQTAMGLLMAQAQNSGIEVTQATEQELKNSIEKKYSRQFFASQNAGAMKELSKDELVSILSFYNTPAGAKFLKLSPKIIEGTMSSTQTDLQQWLPSTVEALVSKLRGNKGGSGAGGNVPQPNSRQIPPPQGPQGPQGQQPADREDINS